MRKTEPKKPRRSARGPADSTADVSTVEVIDIESEEAVPGEKSRFFGADESVAAPPEPRRDDRHLTPKAEWGPRVTTTTPPGSPPPDLSHLGTPWFQDEPCRIYTVDSLGGKHKAVVTALGKYLREEALAKKRCTAPVPHEAILEVKAKVRRRRCGSR